MKDLLLGYQALLRMMEATSGNLKCSSYPAAVNKCLRGGLDGVETRYWTIIQQL